MQPKGKKPGSTIEIVALLVVLAASIWIPKQQSLFNKDKISEGQAESDSYLNFVSSSELLMTSDKVLLPEAWSNAQKEATFELRVLKLRSKQVRFVQSSTQSPGVNDVRMIAAESNDEMWVVESVKRMGNNGKVESLEIANIDGERTTPYVELGSGANDFSIVYRLKHDKTRTQHKKIRLISADASSVGA